MRWLLDTNVVIDAFAGRSEAVKVIRSARGAALEWIGYSAITRLEVLGFPELADADEAGLRQLLAQFSEAPVMAPVIEKAIEIRRSVRIKTPDAIIAATALIYGASLVTRNARDFSLVTELAIVDPTSL
jgi:predicted nucleic acid-binding protein